MYWSFVLFWSSHCTVEKLACTHSGMGWEKMTTFLWSTESAQNDLYAISESDKITVHAMSPNPQYLCYNSQGTPIWLPRTKNPSQTQLSWNEMEPMAPIQKHGSLILDRKRRDNKVVKEAKKVVKEQKKKEFEWKNIIKKTQLKSIFYFQHWRYQPFCSPWNFI